jgi:ubiquinone/menaquinone biosynthesis C-methylase UbiE
MKTVCGYLHCWQVNRTWNVRLDDITLLLNPMKNIIGRYFDHLYGAMCDQRYIAQKKLVEHDPDALLLDCGSRTGDNTLSLAQPIGTKRMIGLDYNLRSLYQARKRGIIPLHADLNQYLPLSDDSVDLIVATDVIEHLVDPALFVREMHRVLKKNGYAIIDTPNLASWHNIFALLSGLQPFSGPNLTTMEDADLSLVRQMHRKAHGLEEQGEFVEHGEKELTRHIVVVAYRSLIKLLVSVGFQIERAYGFGYYPLPVFLARLFQRIDIAHTHHVLIKARKTP